MESKEKISDDDRELRRKLFLEKNLAYDQLGTYALICEDVKIWGSVFQALTRLGFYSSIFYRISRCLVKHRLSFIGRAIQFLSTLLTGAEISNKAIIGPGLKILHASGVLIGPTTILGARSVICECSSITGGREKVGIEKQIIGDSIWLSAGGRIMGDVILGDKVWIGPNSVVLKDVKSNMMAFGIPARVVPEVFQFRYKGK